MITQSSPEIGRTQTSLSLMMVCHNHDGELRFSTLSEYDDHDVTGSPLWEGAVIVTPSASSGLSSGCYYVPDIGEDLVSCLAHRAAELRVLAEGERTVVAARSVH